MKKACLMAVVFISLQGISQNIIQATLKLNSNPDEVEVWLKPNFSNSTSYLAQILLPIAWPASAPVQPTLTSANVTYAASFISAFGNYNTPGVYLPAQNAAGTEKYQVIFLERTAGNSSGQNWTNGVEFKVVTIKFPTGSPGSKVKIADYTAEGGGSNGQGYYYTADGNANYFILLDPVNSFYSTPGQSTGGGTGGNGYIQTNVAIPVTCAQPTLSINNITTVGAEINWPVAGGATGYEYAITGSNVPPVSGTATTSTSFTASGLTAATQYYVHVRTNCGAGGFSGWSTSNFTTASAPCNTPTTPNVSNIVVTTAEISWNTVIGATGYEYFLSTSSTTPGSAAGSGTATTGTMYNASGLIGNTQYYIFVRTNCGISNYSPWVSANFTTQPPLCTPPSIPTINGITTTTADINWNAISGSAGYEYVISTSSGIPAGAGTAIPSTSFSPTGLTPGTTYYVFVRNNCGGGLYSSWSSTNFNTMCPSPALPTVNPITSSSATISWNATGAVSYQYDISTSSTPTTATPSTDGTTTAGTSYNATGLASGTTYYAHVRAICAAGNFSNWVTVSFATICIAPGTITVPVINPTTANINWGGVSDAQGYEYVVTTGNSPTAPGTPVSSTSALVTNLTQGTQYNVFVRTKCNPGVFSDWTKGTFTTTFSPCIIPSGLQITNINDNVSFSWSPVNGAIGYEYVVSTSFTAPATNGTFTTSLSASVSNLNTSTLYYIYVRTQCGPGRYSDWTYQTFMTICYKPIIYFVRNLPTLGTANLAWHSVKGSVKYEYAILNNAAPPSGSVNLTIDTVIHASGLIPGNRYYFHVRARCNNTGISDWSTQEFYASGLSIYPSSQNVFTIVFYGSEIKDGELALYDGSGKLLRTIKFSLPTLNIDMNIYASGIYYIRYGENKKFVKKFIKL